MSISIFYLIHYLSLSLNLSQQVYLKHFSVSLSLSKRISGRYFFLSLSLSHYAWSLSMSLSKLSETFLSLSKRISGRYFFLSFFLIMYGLSKTKLWPFAMFLLLFYFLLPDVLWFSISVRLYVWRLLSIKKNFSSVGSISAKLLGIGSQVWKIKSSFEYYHSTTYLSTYLPFYISSNSSQRKTFRGSELHFVKFESNRFLHLSTSEFGQEMKSMTQSIDVGSSPCR